MEKIFDRPATPEGRDLREMSTYDFLEALNVPYLRVDHLPAFTMEDCEQIDRSLQVKMCKNLFLCNRQQTQFYLLLMPGDKPFRTKELCAQISSPRLSFASPELLLECLGVAPGCATVLALKNDTEHRVKLLIDRSVADQPYIGCHPCVNTSSLRIATKDILETVLPSLGCQPTFVEL